MTDSRDARSRDRRGRSRSPVRDKDRRSRSPDRRPKPRSPRRDRHSRSRSRSPHRETHRSSRRSRSPHRGRSVSRSRSRHRARSHSPRDKRRRSPSRPRSRSASSHSGSSDSDSSRDRRKRRKRHEKEERRREKKARKREKRERKEKKKHKAGKSSAVTGQWGQYGIINESHMYEKDAEFRTWLVEECKVNPEALSKDATKKHFAQFVEDYNTATLPHPKFYNMASYERQMNSLRNGMTADVISDTYDLNADLAAHTSRHKRPAAEPETHLSREQLMELRKVQNERIEAGKMKLLGMEIKGSLGVRMDGTEFE